MRIPKPKDAPLSEWASTGSVYSLSTFFGNKWGHDPDSAQKFANLDVLANLGNPDDDVSVGTLPFVNRIPVSNLST